jgi:protein-S-isoprenylcysteine O-methyltransferase Ste14
VREHALIYLAALCTLGQIGLALFIDNPAAPLPLAALALMSGLLALVLMFWPLFSRARFTNTPLGTGATYPTAVCDQGPYALVRHPQYLGYMLLNLTFILTNPHWLSILLGATAVLCFTLYARQEEQQLLDQFGPGYETYRQRVPAFNLPLGLLRQFRS